MNEDISCAGCVYFVPREELTDGRQGGQCRRRAPNVVILLDKVRSKYPLSWADDWCGEHSQAPQVAR